MGAGDDNLGTQTRERLGLLMKTQASAERFKAKGQAASELGQKSSVALTEVEAIIEDWPEAPKTVGQKLLDHYGPPNEATPTKLFWYRNGPWARTELSADEVVHDFPTPHTDFLTQFIDYRIDPGACFRRRGLRRQRDRGPHCWSDWLPLRHEPFNMLTVNLAVEIMEANARSRRPGTSTARPRRHS